MSCERLSLSPTLEWSSRALSTRALLYGTLKGQIRIHVTSVAAQGSLGTDPWNVAYDNLLWTAITVETRLCGYADVGAAHIAARNV